MKLLEKLSRSYRSFCKIQPWRNYHLVIVPPTDGSFCGKANIREFCVTLRPRLAKANDDLLALMLEERLMSFAKRYRMEFYFVYEYSREGALHIHGFLWHDTEIAVDHKFKNYCQNHFGRTCIYAVSEGYLKINRKVVPTIEDRLQYFHKRLTSRGLCENGHPPKSNVPDLIIHKYDDDIVEFDTEETDSDEDPFFW